MKPDTVFAPKMSKGVVTAADVVSLCLERKLPLPEVTDLAQTAFDNLNDVMKFPHHAAHTPYWIGFMLFSLATYAATVSPAAVNQSKPFQIKRFLESAKRYLNLAINHPTSKAEEIYYPAMTRLAEVYESGLLYNEADVWEMAHALRVRSAAGGEVMSMFQLARHYSYGYFGVRRNWGQAHHYLDQMVPHLDEVSESVRKDVAKMRANTTSSCALASILPARRGLSLE